MSVKPEERISIQRESYETCEQETMGRDYCNLNIATFTFGGRGSSLNNCNLPISENQNQNGKNTKSHLFSSENKLVYEKEKKVEDRVLKKPETRVENFKDLPRPALALSSIENPIGSHHSFLAVVVHSIWNLKLLRNFILNEISLSEKDSRNRLLIDTKSLLLKYSHGKTLEITKLRASLADLFQNRRKFLVDQPDDPVDCLFAFLNAIHSYSMKHPLNEVVDSMCSTKCPTHREFWLDLCRVDECDCKGNSKRFYSNHNFIFDLPLDKVFDLSNNMNLIEMSKSFKLKSGKISEVGSNEITSLVDLKGKLFLYFKLLLNYVKVECPAKGIRCEVNKTYKSFFLSNSPSYLSFSLQKQTHINTSVMEILKTFILIPKIFDLGTLFDHSSKQKIFFEFFGAILLKPGKSYTCFFKNKEMNKWIHYDDEKISSYSSWFDLLSSCLKNSESPILLFYQKQEKFTEEKDIGLEEILLLEKHARNADNLSNTILNRFRSNEEIIKFESFRGLQPTGKISDTSAKHNSNSRIDQVTEYSCIECFSKNRIECPVCLKCSKNNEAQIEDLLKKRGMNYINIANFNLNINTSGVEVKNKEELEREREREREREKFSSLSSKKSNCNNPFAIKETSALLNNNYGQDEESESDYDRSSNAKKKYYNMPMQMKNKKENPVIVKNINLESQNPGNTNTKQEDKPIYKTNKRTLTIEEKSSNYEDRAQPYEMVRSKSRKAMSTHSNKNLMPESWFCEACKKINKPYEYKCQDCRKINSSQREVLETFITNGSIQPDHHYKPSLQIQPSSFKSPEKKVLERKNTEKKLNTVNMGNTTGNNYLSNPEHKKACLCYSSEKVIKNSICTLCNRYIDSNPHENSIKKRNQEILQTKNNPQTNQNNQNNINTFNVKRADTPSRVSDPKMRKEESSSNLHKFRSPSNVMPTKQRNTTISRYKDIFIEEEDLSGTLGPNPFTVAKKPEKPEKSEKPEKLDKTVQNTHSSNSSACRNLSANKKKTESAKINENHSASLNKNKK